MSLSIISKFNFYLKLNMACIEINWQVNISFLVIILFRDHFYLVKDNLVLANYPKFSLIRKRNFPKVMCHCIKKVVRIGGGYANSEVCICNVIFKRNLACHEKLRNSTLFSFIHMDILSYCNSLVLLLFIMFFV